MRTCICCHKPIKDCFGFVKAGDFLDLLNKKSHPSQVKEICGTCVLPALFMETENDLFVFMQKIGWV